MNIRVRINHQIRVSELRVITDDGQNLGVMSTSDALKKAQEMGLDLIEISPNAIPPVAKIMDYGKFQYTEKKKLKDSKSKIQNIEVKSIQVKIGTDDHDLELKAKKASEWLKEGHRVKLNLFLTGRAKYLNHNFLQERLERMFKLVTEEYRIAEPPQRGPKGLTTVIERVNKSKV
ncbi:MAG: translation initiation factor IF-3 [Candidatus Paceibacterota bacterium]|nr:translation initiation factor IF-3 [Candidatus Paceibacterota bacterium]